MGRGKRKTLTKEEIVNSDYTKFLVPLNRNLNNPGDTVRGLTDIPEDHLIDTMEKSNADEVQGYETIDNAAKNTWAFVVVDVS